MGNYLRRRNMAVMDVFTPEPLTTQPHKFTPATANLASWDTATNTGYVKGNGTSAWACLCLTSLKYKTWQVLGRKIVIDFDYTTSGITSNGQGAFVNVCIFTTSTPSNISSHRKGTISFPAIKENGSGHYHAERDTSGIYFSSAGDIRDYWIGIVIGMNSDSGSRIDVSNVSVVFDNSPYVWVPVSSAKYTTWTVQNATITDGVVSFTPESLGWVCKLLAKYSMYQWQNIKNKHPKAKVEFDYTISGFDTENNERLAVAVGSFKDVTPSASAGRTGAVNIGSVRNGSGHFRGIKNLDSWDNTPSDTAFLQCVIYDYSSSGTTCEISNVTCEIAYE